MRSDIYCSSDPDDPRRLSPLIISVANSDLEITNMLRRNRADPYLGQLGNSELQEAGRPQRGDLFALEEACYSGDIQMARLLISFRVDVYMGYPLVYTFSESLDDQKFRGRAEIMDLLLASGVDTPLRAALKHTDHQHHSSNWVTKPMPRDVEFVQYLLAEGAEVNAPAAPLFGVTTLQGAAFKSYLRIAQILLEHGAHIDVDPSPYGGRRAIEGAAERRRIDMVKLLLDNYYDGPRPISEVCKSAVRYAREQNQWYMMEFFESFRPLQK
ncbi:uncharacterized protein Z519_06116 [Cladophialophora bantiana CBS 173.52]|uniref:Ankyrin n=1 Tax=Cladophialophora bantiana (strain ATCC 10958 / CBS 173.52 / CDC B-1940 / NIH 8579) TaxID=1442370 RepID=A0A0D2EUJ7_CLAB1|nr:uncharacterized protein Z519_06116 [Cladophialophora bantiana CBS 173.52]KIW93511.1 hypothetical protein Z519_06116 [Cladophialophora bantiana CBS 173.52]